MTELINCFYPNAYFKLAFTSRTFTQDIYSSYTCIELYEKILENINRYIIDNTNSATNSDNGSLIIHDVSQFEIIPIKNTEHGLALRKINDKLLDILDSDDMQAFYIRLI